MFDNNNVMSYSQGDMELNCPQPMVAVNGAFKRYTSKSPILLRGFSMTVPTGAIYGLLGPSGCGKTTLLNCIVGNRRLDSGQVTLGITKRKELGYMPQEVALNEEFTIEETFFFYGKLFDMSRAQVKMRMKELLTFFDLPTEGFIGELSGGQQRRVSFAVALLHNPQLLILDEPTVGVDPVLCSRIWDALVKMALEEKKTIIITTHYIEEARQCQLIGLMRGGVLLAEEPPLTLMASHNCNTLEQVFLELSQKQHEASNKSNEDLTESDTDYKKMANQHFQPPLISSQMWKKSRFSAQLFKNVVWMKRNVPIMMFLLFLPFLLFTIYCSVFGKTPTGLSLGIVSEELGSLADCQANSTEQAFNYTDFNCYFDKPLSCLYFEHLKDNDFNLIEYNKLETGQTALERNKVWGLLHFTRNYTIAVLERIDYGFDTAESVVRDGTVDVRLDMSDHVIGTSLQRMLLTTYNNFIGEVYEACGSIAEAGKIPIKYNEPIYGGSDPLFSYTTLPGYLMSFSFYLPMLFTSGAIMLEKLSGLMERKMIAGMTMLEIVTAHAVVQIFILFCQTGIIFYTAYGIFDNPVEGDLYLLILLTFINEIAGMCYGFMLSEIHDSDTNCSYAGTGTVLALFMTTGTLWPMEGAHPIMRAAMWVLPVNAAVTSYHSIALRGYSISNPVVYRGFLSTLAWCAFFAIGAILINRVRKGVR
ncbi:ABC transporter G family member 23 isoform X1 [Nilaparvata lugens]|uniref:ABC transporter G family member 23 isoform X1 n=2 Tax=Nilaparvata lugens TaxID=108931 RepID=UPI00193E50CB|nr:ABC transporter G family member 23 isoform X1 [Nilaparvata lugens]